MSDLYQMPSSASLDDTDKLIISMLHENSRVSYTEIGKKVGLSRVAVQMRIQNLVEQEVIEQFTVVVNPAKMGIHVSAFFNVEVEPQFLDEVAQTLENENAVSSLYLMSGPSKLHMHGIFATQQEMEQFLIHTIYPLKGVVSVDCQMLLKRYKSRMGMKL